MTMNQANGSSNTFVPRLVTSLVNAASKSAQEGKSKPKPEENSAPDERPTMDVKKPMNFLVDESVRLLADDPAVFQMRAELVHVVAEEEGQIKSRHLKNSQTRYLLAEHATWVNGNEKVHPPEHIAKCVVERTTWEGIRVLRAVTPFPAIDADGKIANEAGYDASTKTYFSGVVKVEVPEAPSQDDAERAVAVLLDVVQDFPFASDEHKAAWIAGLLTPLARFAHDGNAPLILVQANCARAGKTTLVKVISEIVCGVQCPVVTFTKNEDETRKRIFTFLRQPRSMVLIDNVVGQFGGANINAMLTTGTFNDRILGQTKCIEVRADASWFVTGNNMSLAPDTAERCVNVRLQSKEEKPHLRTDFKYPFLFEVVRERRGVLLSAALTILKAFIVAGKPKPDGLTSWGGFETWSRLVRSAVMFAGLPDPALTRFELEEQADTEGDEKANLIFALDEWQKVAANSAPYTAHDVIDQVRANPDAVPSLRRALTDLLRSPGGVMPTTKVLSRHLRDAKLRNFGGLMLVCEEHPKSAHRWFVREVETKSEATPEG